MGEWVSIPTPAAPVTANVICWLIMFRRIPMQLSPAKFVQQWGSGIRPLRFAKPMPIFSEATAEFVRSGGFPSFFHLVHFREIDFLEESIPMSTVWHSLHGDEWRMPHSWNAFWKIGTVDYGQPTATLCIEEVSGTIVAIDDEEGPHPLVMTVNSSPMHMAECMRLIRDWYTETNGDLNDPRSIQRLLHLRRLEVFGDGQRSMVHSIRLRRQNAATSDERRCATNRPQDSQRPTNETTG